MDLKAKIRKLRKKKGLSQGELADRVGINPSHMSRLETGKFQPSIDALKGLAEALDVTTDYLLNEDDELPEVKIQNKGLSERIRLIDTLEPEDQQALIQVIDSMLTKQRMKQLLEGQLFQGSKAG